jgi:hypothetical protein
VGPTARGSPARGAALTGTLCGNGVREQGEACDRSDLGASSCGSLGLGAGRLRCDASCSYDTAACKPELSACRTLEAPFSLAPACAADMCDCDREAFTNCAADCWAQVACRIATCNNAPTRRECAEGCPNSSAAELSLGRCFRSSKACTSSLPGLDLN